MASLKKKSPAKPATKSGAKSAAKKAVKKPIKKTAKKTALTSAEAIKNPEAVFYEIGRVNNILSQKVMELPLGRAVLAKAIKKSLKDPENYTLTVAPFNKKELAHLLDACLCLAKLEKAKAKLSTSDSKEYQTLLIQLAAKLSSAFVDGSIFYETVEKLLKDPAGMAAGRLSELKKLCSYYNTLEVLAHHWTHFMLDAEYLDRF